MLEETQKPNINGNVKLSIFLEKMKPYIIGEPRIVSGEKTWDLKPSVLQDSDKWREIQDGAAQNGVTLSMFPKPRFSIKASLQEETETFSSGTMYLHASQIEGGGPQPRTKN